MITECPTAFYGYSFSGAVEHLTLNQCTQLGSDWNGTNYGTTSTLKLTNSLLVNLAGYGNINYSLSACDSAASSNLVFQTVGAGGFYLQNGSPYRNTGTTNINAALTADLKTLTTYPPIVRTNDFTTNSTLFPQAQRDVDAPDLGYHYDPLDWCWSGLNLTNATLTLTNGVAVGIYGVKGTVLRTNGSSGFATNGPMVTGS